MSGSEPRARARLHKADGTVEDVTDKLEGADEYFRAWQSNVETPHQQQVTAWQQTDETHPPGAGRPAYRVAYRTLKMVPHPGVEMTWPNLRVTVLNGDVERGGIDFRDVIPGRRPDQHVIPEHGRVLHYQSGTYQYLPCPDLRFQPAGWEETIKAVSYVEVIWVANVPEPEPAKLLELGRDAVAPLLTLLEFEFGPRLLSTRMLEEVGETFDDWHWNRRISTGTVHAETQASFIHLPAADFVTRAHPLIERHQSLPSDERVRFRLAARWYWSVQEETDNVLAFVQWWLIVECLEMVKTTDIRPVRQRLMQLLTYSEDAIRDPLGRLFGLRSRLLHGAERDVSDDSLRGVESVARLFLADRAGTPALKEKDTVRSFFGLA